MGGFNFKITINKTTFKALLWHDIILPWVILIYIYNYTHRLIFNWFSGKTIFFTTTSNKHKIMYMSSSYSVMGHTVSFNNQGTTKKERYLHLYEYTLFVCLVKTAEPIGLKFFCGTFFDPRQGLWMIEFSNICL